MTPLKDTVLLNFCVLPTQNVGESCVKISQSLKSDGTLFVLGDGKFAHMTMYMARFVRKDVEDVIKKAREALSKVSPFPCHHCGYFMTAGHYLEVSYVRSPEFDQLHGTLISAVKGLRANPGNPHEEGYFTPYTATQRKNAAETGYDLAYELFRPHITLTRYGENKLPEAFPSLPEAKLSFNLETIALYEADDNGAVFKKLAEFTI